MPIAKWMLMLSGMTAALMLAAQDYYLSPAGNDDAPGTRTQPWGTIDKANAALRPGDTAIFLAGSYPGCIAPARSGERGKPITYRAEKFGDVTLTADNPEGYAVLVANRSYLAIDGFRFRVVADARWLKFTGVTHSTVENCDFDGTTVANPIRCENSHYNRFRNLSLMRCNYTGRSGVLSDDMWNNFNVSHTVFEKLYVSRVGHRPFGLWFDCEKNVVRDSIFDCRWGRNFEFFSPTQVLMERCVVTNAFEGSGSADGRAKLFTIDSIFRNNLIMRNGYGPLVINAYKYHELPTFGMINSRLYNNTWYKNQDCAWQMVDNGTKPEPHMVRGNIVKNNIMVDNNYTDGTALLISDNVAPDNRFSTNLLRGFKPGQKTVVIPWPEKQSFTAEEANRARPQQYRDNFDADPGFSDPDQDDYTLRPGSPAIDRAEALTTVTQTGKSRLLPVADARYFYDGYQIPGEVGDLIVVGKSKTGARVVRADYDRNILTLDREIAFAAGDEVNRPHTGVAPDLGAYESGNPATGPELFRKTRIPTMDDGNVPLVRADMEPDDLENWFYLWNFTRQPHSNGELDKSSGGADGSKGAWKVYATDSCPKNGGSNLSCYIAPTRWNIDRYPYLEFAYRIPQGVPVGVWVGNLSNTGVTQGTPAQVFLGGSPAFKSGSVKDLQLCKLIDDGKWHTVRLDVRAIRKVFPEVKYLARVRFWTGWENRNGKPGDCYWIDNLSIQPVNGTGK